MALPKYKTSRANTHTRRSAWKTSSAKTVRCESCGARRLAMTACPNCGVFRGRRYKGAVASRMSQDK